MAKSLRILLLVHPYFRPDLKNPKSSTEYDVWKTLKALGHNVEISSAQVDLSEFETDLRKYGPQIVFNLLEEFRDEAVYDFHLISYLESKKIAFTGCNPRGLVVSRNKFWCLSVAEALGLPVPRHANLTLGSSRSLGGVWPRILKFNREHSSLGIQSSSIVYDERGLRKELKRLRKVFQGEIVEQEFIAGKEVTVSVMGNHRPRSFAPWQLNLKTEMQMATERVKFSAKHRHRHRIRATQYRGPIVDHVEKVSRQLYVALDLSGYARFDFRVRDGQPYLIDVNANPNLAKTEDFAKSAACRGLKYPDLLEELVNFGFRYDPRR